jgi:hypothetical protein
MRELIIKKGLRRTRLMMYDDIEQLPIERFNKANKFWMLSDNLGNSFEDIDKVHLSRLFLIAGDKEKAVKEINNLRVLVYNIINETHPDQLAFASLIHSVNGKEVTDISDEGLRVLLKMLSDKGLSIGEVKKKSIKQALNSQLEVCFADIFKNGLSSAYWQLVKKRTLKELEALQGKDVASEIREIDRNIEMFVDPKDFMGASSYELKYDGDFEKNCIILSEYANKPVKALTTKEYFTLLQHHNKLMKEREKKKK